MPISTAAAAGAVLGLVLGQLHVWWRHTCEIGWVSPPWLVRISRIFGSRPARRPQRPPRQPRRGVRRPLPFLRRSGPGALELRAHVPAPAPHRLTAARAHSRPAAYAPRATSVTFPSIRGLMTKRVLFLISDTGGGHRSGAQRDQGRARRDHRSTGRNAVTLRAADRRRRLALHVPALQARAGLQRGPAFCAAGLRRALPRDQRHAAASRASSASASRSTASA